MQAKSDSIKRRALYFKNTLDNSKRICKLHFATLLFNLCLRFAKSADWASGACAATANKNENNKSWKK
jgi:hypothetical protein